MNRSIARAGGGASDVMRASARSVLARHQEGLLSMLQGPVKGGGAGCGPASEPTARRFCHQALPPLESGSVVCDGCFPVGVTPLGHRPKVSPAATVAKKASLSRRSCSTVSVTMSCGRWRGSQQRTDPAMQVLPLRATQIGKGPRSAVFWKITFMPVTVSHGCA